MAELRPIIVFHVPILSAILEFVILICVKLLQVMSGIIPHNLKKTSLSQTVFLASTNAAHTHRQRDIHTNTHDDSIRRNAMRCISSKNASCSVHISHAFIRRSLARSWVRSRYRSVANSCVRSVVRSFVQRLVHLFLISIIDSLFVRLLAG